MRTIRRSSYGYIGINGSIGSIAVTDEVEFGSESGGSEINTTVCVPVVAHACQSSAVP